MNLTICSHPCFRLLLFPAGWPQACLAANKLPKLPDSWVGSALTCSPPHHLNQSDIDLPRLATTGDMARHPAVPNEAVRLYSLQFRTKHTPRMYVCLSCLFGLWLSRPAGNSWVSWACVCLCVPPLLSGMAANMPIVLFLPSWPTEERESWGC